MKAVKSSLFLLSLVTLTACGMVTNKNSGGSTKKMCTKDNCTTDPKCQCWCSEKCGYRDKTSSDHPLYINNDSNGKFCYCKQWDVDNYKARCVDGKNIKQPQGAQ